jgi:hypothetical protein
MYACQRMVVNSFLATTTAWPETSTQLLASGKVLVVGGTTAEFYDPAIGLFTAVEPLITTRSMHTSTLLGDGIALIVDGADEPQKD